MESCQSRLSLVGLVFPWDAAKEPLAEWGVSCICAGIGTAGIFGRALLTPARPERLRQSSERPQVWVKMHFSSNEDNLHFLMTTQEKWEVSPVLGGL